MSEESRSEAGLEGLQSQASEVVAELKEASAAASRRWKVTAWVFGILCAVIAIYLGVLYGKLKPYLKSEEMVKLAAGQIHVKLPEAQKWLVENIKEEAPKIVAELKGQLPRVMDELSATLRESAPQRADWLRDRVLDRILPDLKKSVRAWAGKELRDAPEQLTSVIDEAIQQIVKAHKDDIAALEGPELTEKLKDGFERAAGDVLDEFSKGLEQSIKSVKASLADLLEKQKLGTLTEEERLKLRYVQLWRTYLDIRVKEEEKAAE